jgi:HPt (histidine-containing phosphotransfer) domain-containing protein
MQSTKDLNANANRSSGSPHLGSDAQHYRRTLQAFLGAEKHAIEEIQRALQDRQVRKAMRLANTLKSQARSLGVFGLHQASSDLVHALDRWAAVAHAVDAALHRTESQLWDLRQALSQTQALRISYSNEKELRPNLTEDQAKALMEQIITKVHSNDLEALYLLEQHHTELVVHYGAYIQPVENALKEIDFVTASTLLGQLARIACI